MKGAVNFARGYCELTVSGQFPERFINICARGGVDLWHLARTEDGGYSARTHRKNARLVRELAERAMCVIHIKRTRGAPRVAAAFVRRHAFMAGMLLCIAFVWFMSLRVWEFEVVGNEVIASERILDAMAELGVGVGVSRSRVDSHILSTEILVQIPDLRWLAVNIHGSKAYVEVRERQTVPELVDEKSPANVVARRAGVIEYIAVLEGAAQVVVGDTVEAGQLIASGIVDTVVGARLVHAMADVQARTYYTMEAATPLIASFKLHTGAQKTRSALIIGSRRINLYFGSSILMEDCDKIIERSRLTLPGGLALPITWEKITYSSYNAAPSEQDGMDAEAYLEEVLLERLESESDGAEVLRTEFAFEERGGMLYATLSAECMESIAETAEIPLDAGIFALLEQK